MMAMLGFVLQCAAIAALLGAGASALIAVVAVSLRSSIGRLSPSARGDLAFLACVSPAIVAIVVTAATAAPSIAGAVGLAHDHCLHHDNHHHVCFVHGEGISPSLALLGAAALAVWTLRAGRLFVRLLRLDRDARALEELGTTTAAGFPIVEIPGEPWLCHAVGAFRRRVLLSRSLAEALGPNGLRSALAHEAAHLQRRDPLANLLMSVAGLFALPAWAGFVQRAYRAAAEQACDDAAARQVGDGSLVAEALLVVARLQGMANPGLRLGEAFGLGQHPLEARVHRLLAGRFGAPRRALALPVGAALTALSFFVALHRAEFFHHAVETVLYRLF